jgi:hypothetical protein
LAGKILFILTRPVKEKGHRQACRKGSRLPFP